VQMPSLVPSRPVPAAPPPAVPRDLTQRGPGGTRPRRPGIWRSGLTTGRHRHVPAERAKDCSSELPPAPSWRDTVLSPSGMCRKHL
jgi:hypothetical protein